ncbi:MAG TPA: FAD-binding oxidoreductase [Dongiaceae bacterium]|jgi:glycine/D-amino acid oxidase-like deaminating enzyme|nr:FAD-binding oxidoreductase [Dongiaceae bacterium]
MKTTPFWWEEAEPQHGERSFDRTACSALIVGSGYSGLSAAITLAEAGVAGVMVVDSMRIGEGASSRNGGQIGNSPKFTLAEATARFGEKRAIEIMADYDGSMRFMLKRAATLPGPFDLNLSGIVTGAHSRKDMAKFYELRDRLPPEDRKSLEILDRSQVHTVLKTDIYRGALVKHDQGTIHPAKYVRALADRARELGVRIFTGFRFEGARRAGQGHAAQLTDVLSGETVGLQADKILFAMNGYVAPRFRWLRQRTIPVQSYMIATEELPFEFLEELIPNNRGVGDTKHVLYYFRRSPDGRRILFGGRARFRNSTEQEAAVGLKAFMAHTFPETKGVGVTHAWLGNVCFAYDFCSHGGRMDDGIYFVSCCNGGGISNNTHLGHRIAEHMLERPGADRGVIGSHFPRLYFYNGHPWFLPIVGTWYRFLDRQARWFG